MREIQTRTREWHAASVGMLVMAGLSLAAMAHARPPARTTASQPPAASSSRPAAVSSAPAAGQDRPVAAQPTVGDEGGTVRLELRVFNGTEDVTGDVRLRLFPRGQRTNDVPTTIAPGQAITATVPVGFYDAQAILEKKGQVLDIRWAEQLLVQRYPDEYGRHLEVINFKPTYGALQIRPAPDAAASTKGWSASAYAAGDTNREISKAVQAGDDLIFALPGGSYDVKVTLGDKSTQWLKDIEVPADRTRLKTWTSGSASR